MHLRLKSKIIGITVAIILFMSVVFSHFIRTTVYTSLKWEIDKRAFAIGKHFAELSAEAYLTDSTSVLKSHLADYIATESYLAYIVIVDGTGQVVAHSFTGQVPDDVLHVIATRSRSLSIQAFHRSDGTELEDFFVPVGSGDAGNVHIGIFESKVSSTINQLILKLLPYLLAVVLAGVFAAFLLATALTRPLNILSKGVERVSRGELDVLIDVRTSDEIGQLADAFNSMTSRLRSTTVSREYMEKLFDSMNEVLIVISPEGAVRSVNRAYCDLFGYRSEDVVGQHVDKSEEQDLPLCTYSAFLHALKHDYVQGIEGTCRTSDGRLVPMLFSLATMKDDQGNVQAVICAAQDVSSLKKAQEALHRKQSELEEVNRNLESIVSSRTAELAVGNESLRLEIAERRKKTQELRAARDAAESANRAKTEFLANMSHEMRTPLNSIIGGTEYLGNAPLAPDQSRCLEMIRQAGETLLVQVNDLIDLARIEAGQLVLTGREFNLMDTLEAAVRMLAIDARRKQLDLSLEISPETPHFVIGDQVRLQQVLVNLIANAIKFTDNGGKISVSVQRGRTETGTVEVYFTVRDSGIGIEADKLEVIFDSFVQADSSITRRYGGSGLGLAISRRLVEAMGGGFRVESEPGVGSSFTFFVRFALSNHGLNLLETAGDSAIGGGEVRGAIDPVSPDGIARLLLVDDSLENRELMKLLLARQPFVVDEAGNGQEALELFECNRYSLILMDIQMPVMDGYTATRMMRAIEQREGRRRTPVIALTAHAYEEDVRRCREAGCDDHIAKPFKKQILLQCLGSYIKGVGPF